MISKTGLGQSLTRIGYSSELSEMDKAEKSHPSYDLPHKNWPTPVIVSAFHGR